jgi:hypothetical protein
MEISPLCQRLSVLKNQSELSSTRFSKCSGEMQKPQIGCSELPDKRPPQLAASFISNDGENLAGVSARRHVHNVRSWPKAELRFTSNDVRSWVKSRLHLLRLSYSANDPYLHPTLSILRQRQDYKGNVKQQNADAHQREIARADGGA